MATLTGAQGVSTGHYHAAIVTNNELYETACVKAGRQSGDLTVINTICATVEGVIGCSPFGIVGRLSQNAYRITPICSKLACMHRGGI